jgi:hypothetical protein
MGRIVCVPTAEGANMNRTPTGDGRELLKEIQTDWLEFRDGWRVG